MIEDYRDLEPIPENVNDFIADGSSSMVKLCGNTTNKPYANFTDQIIVISKGGQTIILEPNDLKQLENIVGGKFRR